MLPRRHCTLSRGTSPNRTTPIHPRSSTYVGLSDSPIYPMYFAPQR
jgi:hypothetical protein